MKTIDLTIRQVLHLCKKNKQGEQCGNCPLFKSSFPCHILDSYFNYHDNEKLRRKLLRERVDINNDKTRHD